MSCVESASTSSMDYYYGPEMKQIRADRRKKPKKMKKYHKDPHGRRKYDNVNKFTSEVGGYFSKTYRFAHSECKAQMEIFFNPFVEFSVREQKEQEEADTAMLIPPHPHAPPPCRTAAPPPDPHESQAPPPPRWPCAPPPPQDNSWTIVRSKTQEQPAAHFTPTFTTVLSSISNEDQLLSDLDYGSSSSKQRRAQRREKPNSHRARKGKYWSKIRLDMLCFTPNDRLKANRARILDIKEGVVGSHF